LAMSIIVGLKGEIQEIYNICHHAP